MERIVGWTGRIFLQERATTTLKRSITLLQLRVLRLPREWSGLVGSSHVLPGEDQLTPAVDTRCPADSSDVWTPEATGVIESMVLLPGCFQ